MDERTAASSASIDDDALIVLLRARSAAGLAALYDRYGRLVYSVAARIVQDHGAAEEITQDVFLRCWNHIERYHERQGSFLSWLLAIAHHRAIDELRSRRGKHQRRELPLDDIHYFATGDPGLDDALLREEVRKSLAVLPEAQRHAIELIFWGGLTRREVADRLGLPLGTIHTRLRLGMDKLRSSFDRLFNDD